MNQVFLKFVRQFAAIFRLSAVMLVGALVPFIAACGGGNPPIDITDLERPYTLYGNLPPPEWFEPLWPEANYVIRNRTQFRAAWDAREFYQGRPHPLPDVDFSKYMLVGISKGGDLSCRGVRITHVHQVGEELVVDSQLVRFGAANGPCLFDWVATIDFVLIPQNELSVRFTQTLPVVK